MNISKILKALKDQETYLLNTRERLARLNTCPSDSKPYEYERAKFIGMLEMATIAGVDTQEFKWIYNA